MRWTSFLPPSFMELSAILWVPLHNDLFYLLTQAAQQLRFGQRSQHDTIEINEPHALAARDADVGHRCVAPSRHRAPHVGDLYRRAIFCRDLLDLFGQLDDVNLNPTT